MTTLTVQSGVGVRASAIAAALLLTLLLSAAPAAAETIPVSEALEAQACREEVRVVAPFDDVAEGTTHAEAIACLWAYRVTTGQFVDGERLFRPASTVTRQQMSSFLSRTLEQLPAQVLALPGPDDVPEFTDAEEISGAHVDGVIQLAELGVLQGFDDGSLRPRQELTRAQMATFLVRAIEEVLGEELQPGMSFDDVSGTHRGSIEKLATIGVVQGRQSGLFAPDEPIQRQQMASLLTRALGYLVERGLLQPVAVESGEPGALLGLTEVDAAVQDGFDRVTFTLEGDGGTEGHGGTAGWRVRYVDEPRQEGSGDAIEVDGEVFLEVRLIGMGIPFDLPPEVEAALWEEGRATLDGPAVVEIVSAGVFEGEHQLFIGTRGLLPFEVNRLSDPQRVYLDVEHPS